jgi:chromosome segregation ATPase
MTPMSAPVYSVPENPQQEIVDFLRRLSSMLTGGRNAEMLLQAATAIETLGRRAASAERLFQEQQEDHARNLELREVAELASDNLMSEVESLKAEIDLVKAQLEEREQQLEQSQNQHEIDRNHFAEETRRLQAITETSETRLAEAHAELEQLKAEFDLLKTQLQERERQLDERQQQLEDRQSQHEIDRNQFAEEALRLQAMAEIREARLAAAHAEIEELRRPPPVATFDDSIAVVPVQSLQLARTQFDYLAKGFADNGDIISLTIAEIGARAIDKALADNEPAGDAGVT